jgi:histone H3/H4
VSEEATKPTDEAVLVVISKVKAYIRAKSGMNTSDSVVPILSERIRQLCDEAIESAKSDGRKTVLDRDVKAPEALEPPPVA